MSNKYSVEDLAIFAIKQRPIDFENALNDIMLDRIQSRVDARKEEIATQLYGGALPEKEEPTDEVEENVDETTDDPEFEYEENQEEIEDTVDDAETNEGEEPNEE